MTPSHPGDFIRTEVIEEFGLNVTKASQILGVRRATLSALLNGNAALSPEMALRIEKAFNVSMDMLLRCRLGTTLRRCVRGQTRFVSGGTFRLDRKRRGHSTVVSAIRRRHYFLLAALGLALQPRSAVR